MKLQVAFDFLSIEEILDATRELYSVVDIVEIGTPLIIREGIKAVRCVRAEFPELTILADLKIIDGGSYESAIAYENGADIVTLLGCADDITITAAVNEARKHGKNTMVDFIGIDNIQERIQTIEKLGVDCICIHTAIDVQNTGENPLRDLKIAKKTVKRVEVAVAGGINRSNVDKIAGEFPDIIIIGNGITSAENKIKEAAEIKEIMSSFANK